jgi:TM2 domain-containing membrane protein YozV
MAEWSIEEYHHVQSRKTTAGCLGLILGQFGAHKFYRGRHTAAVATILFNIVTLGFGCFMTWPLGIYEGIKYIRMSPDEYVKNYILGQKDWL